MDEKSLQAELTGNEAILAKAGLATKNPQVGTAMVYAKSLRMSLARLKSGEKWDRPLTVQSFRLGPITITGAAIEIMHRIKRRFRSALGRHALLLSVTNGELGYAPLREYYQTPPVRYAAYMVPLRLGWVPFTPEFQMRKDIPLADQRRYAQLCGLAKIKRDRFAGFAFSWTGRFDIEIGTRQGEELLINAECLKGQVRVAIAQQSSPYHCERRKDESLPGFSFDDCVPFTGNSVRAPIRFRNASVASIPADMRLILRFEVSAGEVFGYEWETA